MEDEDIFYYHKLPGTKRRANRDRIITKRLHIVKDIWKVEDDYDEWFTEKSNRLSKFNLNCTCRLCTPGKVKYSRAKEKRQERLDIEAWM